MNCKNLCDTVGRLGGMGEWREFGPSKCHFSLEAFDFRNLWPEEQLE